MLFLPEYIIQNPHLSWKIMIDDLQALDFYGNFDLFHMAGPQVIL